MGMSATLRAASLLLAGGAGVLAALMGAGWRRGAVLALLSLAAFGLGLALLMGEPAFAAPPWPPRGGG